MNEIGRRQRVRGDSPAMLARLRGVLLDIDGTITNAGRLGAAAYDALERLQSAGMWVIPVTGRPAGAGAT